MAHLEIVEMIEAHGSRPRTLWERILSSQHTLQCVKVATHVRLPMSALIIQ